MPVVLAADGLIVVSAEAERRGAVARPDEVQAEQPEAAPGDEAATRREMLACAHDEGPATRPRYRRPEGQL